MTRLFAQKVLAATVFIVFISLGFASAEAQNAIGSRPARSLASDTTPTIFDVRKSLPMEPTDPTYHDFYINAGVESGFKKGQYLPVTRAIPVHDPVQNKQQAILRVPMGKILVIHVEHALTVARLVSELGDEERPTVEFEAIMIGDKIDMGGITTEAPKELKKRKRGPTAAAPAATAEVSVLVAVPTAATSLASTAPEAVAPTVATSAPAAAAQTPATSAPPASTSATNTPVTPSQPVKSNSASQPSSPPRVTQTVPPPTA